MTEQFLPGFESLESDNVPVSEEQLPLYLAFDERPTQSHTEFLAE